MDSNGINLSFWKNGPAPGSFYNFPHHPSAGNSTGTQRTLSPSTSGTSVLAVKFNKGVIVAADTLGSYGSMAMFRDCDRVVKVNDTTVLGGGGDYADFQYIIHTIQERVIEDECLNDGFQYTPKSLHSWLTRIMYHRRTKFDPLWNTLIVAGLQDGQPYLGQVDKIGCAFEAPVLASGYGAYIALPLLRDALEKNPDITEQEARDLIDQCLKILYYRDARAFNRYKLAIVTEAGSRVEGPFSSKPDWNIAHMVKHY